MGVATFDALAGQTITGTVGDIVAFQMYAVLLLHPVSLIVNSYSSTQQALAALEREGVIRLERDDRARIERLIDVVTRAKK